MGSAATTTNPPTTPSTAATRSTAPTSPTAAPTGSGLAANLVVLVGTLSRDPDTRELPPGSRLGGQVVSFDLTTLDADGRAEAVPVACIDPPAAVAAHRAGEALVVTGRVRRRFFRAGGATQSRTEVVAEHVVPVRHTKRSRAALERALVALTASLEAAGG